MTQSPLRTPPPPSNQGGPPTRQPVFNVPPMTLALTGSILVVFGVIRWGPVDVAESLFRHLTVVPAKVATLVADPSLSGILAELATLFGHAFLHLSPLHLALNAGFLLAFGAFCERSLGRRGLLLVFLASAAGGALVQIAADWGDLALMYGASGGVSGCVGGFARLALADPRKPVRRMATNLVLVMLGLNLAVGLFGGAVMGVEADVAWQAHLGGFAVGFLLARPSARQPGRLA